MEPEISSDKPCELCRRVGSHSKFCPHTSSSLSNVENLTQTIDDPLVLEYIELLENMYINEADAHGRLIAKMRAAIAYAPVVEDILR